jgi:hypothetical protein
MKRIVVYHRDWGIYLGYCDMGFYFWSNLDPAGQAAAVTFESESEARECIAGWEWKTDPEAFDYVRVESGSYATIEECTAAGLPGWTSDGMKDSDVPWDGLED